MQLAWKSYQFKRKSTQVRHKWSQKSIKHSTEQLLGKYSLANVTYHVHTTPDLVSANENCAPHSIWQTPWPFSLSMFWGMLHPSLPPRPSFPKSPSPQENTKPNKHQIAGQTITVLPCARKLLEQDTPTFICQSKSLSISASTCNLNDSVAKEHFNLQNRRSKKEDFEEIMF